MRVRERRGAFAGTAGFGAATAAAIGACVPTDSAAACAALAAAAADADNGTCGANSDSDVLLE